MNPGRKANADAQREGKKELAFCKDPEQKLRCWHRSLITPKRTPKLRRKCPLPLEEHSPPF